MNPTWQDVCIAAITAAPAIVAAIVGVRNGRKIDRHDEWERNTKPEKKTSIADGNTASDPDWYRAPDFWVNP